MRPRPLRWREVAIDAVRSGASQPVRTFATSMATALGVATLVTISSVATMSNAAVQAEFDRRLPTFEVIRPVDLERTGPAPFSQEASDRVRELPHVTAAGAVLVAGTDVAARPGGAPVAAPVLGASTEFLLATGSSLDGGTIPAVPTDGEVAFVGRHLADRIGLAATRLPTLVWVEGEPVTVLGVVTSTSSAPEVLEALVVPLGAVDPAVVLEARMVVGVERGAAEAVAARAGLALDPLDPDAYLIDVPRPPGDLESGVSSQTRSAGLAAGVLALLLGVLSIANVVTTSVLERTSELGVRRAMGARRRDIRRLVLLQATGLGALGGLVGVGLGTLGSLVAGIAGGWPWAMSMPSAAIGLAAATLSGSLSGVVPAERASSVSPSVALRGL